MRRLNNEELSYMHMWGWLARGVFELAISEKKAHMHACNIWTRSLHAWLEQPRRQVQSLKQTHTMHT